MEFQTTIKFPSKNEATEFASRWARATLRGHTIWHDGTLVLDRVTLDEKNWIDAEIEKLIQKLQDLA